MNNVLQIQKNTNNSVLNNSNIIFDTIYYSSTDIQYNNTTGIITINANGTYIIDWMVAYQNTIAQKVDFKLASSNGFNFYSNSLSKNSSINGIGTISITNNIPVELSVINISGNTVFFSNDINTKASLRIFNIDFILSNSECFAMKQLSSLITQIALIYHGQNVSIFSSRIATITGIIESIYISPNSNLMPFLVINSDGADSLISIAEITAIYISAPYDNSITYIQPPTIFESNCSNDLIKNIHDYVSIGDNLSIYTAPNTSGYGDVTLNEYGIIVMADNTSSLFWVTPTITAITKNITQNKNKETIAISQKN